MEGFKYPSKSFGKITTTIFEVVVVVFRPNLRSVSILHPT
jgi:hypothetical protein